MSGAHARSGELNRLIRLERPRLAQDTEGDITQKWLLIKEVFAKIEPLSGRELTAAQQIQAEVSHRFTVRYDEMYADPRAVASWRIVYRGRLFDIKSSLNVGEEDRFVELMAAEGVNRGG